jgi:hypothetical protein
MLVSNTNARHEADPKVVAQYQRHVIHPSLRRDGVDHIIDWYSMRNDMCLGPCERAEFGGIDRHRA